MSFSNQFPEIMSAAYQYVLNKTNTYLKKHLPSTGLKPHISIAIDKSTPHRETNHAVLLILPVDGVRKAIPIDAPIVYAIEDGDIDGGSGVDLAKQVLDVLKSRLDFNNAEDLSYIRGNLFLIIFYIE